MSWPVPSRAWFCLASISSCMSLWHCCILQAALHFGVVSHCVGACHLRGEVEMCMRRHRLTWPALPWQLEARTGSHAVSH